jgi:large subunit ribosomal protein L17
MLANLVCSLIKERRITTTLAKARAARPVAEKMITLGKKGSVHHRRLAASRLHQEDAVRILFNEIAPLQKDRPGGYTRIVKLHQRRGDAAKLAILEWVDAPLDALDADADSTPANRETSVSKPAPASAAQPESSEGSAGAGPKTAGEPKAKKARPSGDAPADAGKE